MTDQEFLTSIKDYEELINPAVYRGMVDNVDLISDASKEAILKKLQETGEALVQEKMRQDKLVKEGLVQMDIIHKDLKIQYRNLLKKDEKEETKQEEESAESLISNL